MICQSRIFYTNLKLEDFCPLLKFLIGTRTIHEKALSFCSTHFLHYRSIWCLPFFSTSSSIYMLRSFSTYLYFYWGRLLWNVCCVFLPSGLLLQLLLEQPTTFESWLVSREFLTLFMLCTLFIYYTLHMTVRSLVLRTLSCLLRQAWAETWLWQKSQEFSARVR